MAAYLVLFVADPAGDHHADALRAVARRVPGAGFFDEPDATERTVGTFLRAEDPREGRALVEAVAAVSARLDARIEVQHREVVLGWIDAGVPDAELAAALRDIPEAL